MQYDLAKFRIEILEKQNKKAQKTRQYLADSDSKNKTLKNENQQLRKNEKRLLKNSEDKTEKLRIQTSLIKNLKVKITNFGKSSLSPLVRFPEQMY